MNEWKWTESIFDFAPNYTCSFLRNMKSLLITEMVNRSVQILNSSIKLQKKNICQGLWGGQIKVTKHLFACSHNFQEKKTQQNQTKLLFASINNWELYVAPDCFYMREESVFFVCKNVTENKVCICKKSKFIWRILHLWHFVRSLFLDSFDQTRQIAWCIVTAEFFAVNRYSLKIGDFTDIKQEQ